MLLSFDINTFFISVCTTIPTDPNGVSDPATGPLNTDDTVTLTCNDGYLIAGTSLQSVTFVCLSDGGFFTSMTSNPTCVRGKHPHELVCNTLES